MLFLRPELIRFRRCLFVLLLSCLLSPSADLEARGSRKTSDAQASKTKSRARRAPRTKAKHKRKSKPRAKDRRKKPKPKRQRYTAVRGDSWSTVAKLLKVKLRSLKRWNKRVSRRKLKPGQRVVFYAPPRDTESVGLPHRGSLKHGIHLDPDGDGLGSGFAVSKRRPDLWGTPELVKLVKQCGRSYRRYFSRKYAPIPVGDLSSRNGGPLKKHKSHQSGRDVDVGYMRKRPLAKGYFKDTTARQMNLYAQWVVLKCFLDDPQTDKIFIERSLVRALRRYVQRIYKKRKPKLNKYLAYFPGGKRKRIYPDKVHKSHMHVRIKCPKGDRKCSG